MDHYDVNTTPYWNKRVTQMAVGMGTGEAAQSVECNSQKPSRSNSTQVYSRSSSSHVYSVPAGARHVFVRLQTCI
jgi:hypothetical protein